MDYFQAKSSQHRSRALLAYPFIVLVVILVTLLYNGAVSKFCIETHGYMTVHTMQIPYFVCEKK